MEQRSSHPNSIVLSRLINFDSLGNKDHFSSHISFDYSKCKLRKSKSLSFPSHGSWAKHCFDLIHSDIWDITPIISHAHYKYFITFIDDYNRYTRVYFLQIKVEVFYVFQEFVPTLKLNSP